MRFLIHGPLALVLAACGSSPSNTASTANSAGSATALQGQDEARPSADRPFQTREVVRFSTPWAMEFLPGSGAAVTNMALVTEKEGNLWLVDVATGDRRQVAGVPQVKVAGQGGLGEVVAHPDFAANRRIYLSYAEAGPGETSGAAIGYGTLDVSADRARIEDFKVIWRQEPKVTGNGHFAHRIAFAPDGTMFVTSGDRQKMQPAQDKGSDLGKIIHMTAEGERLGGRFHTMGHRNPLGIAFAPDARLWSTEMGPQGGDELNLIVRGRNYGWPAASYGDHYDGEAIPDDHSEREFEEPKAWWNPAISPGGLLIYTGDLFSDWRGDAIIPALSGQALVRVDIDGDQARKADHWEMNARIRAVEQGPDGAIYVLEDGRAPGQGRMLRLAPTG